MDDFEDKPLGPEDASDRSQDDLSESFISPEEIFQINRGSVLSAHKLIVGRKGAGKTHVLNKIAAEAEDLGRTVQHTALTDDLINYPAVRHGFSDQSFEASVSAWAALWRIAIAISVLSNFLSRRPNSYFKRINKKIGDDLEIARIRDDLEHHYNIISFDFRAPQSPTEVLKKILNQYKNSESLSNLRFEFPIQDFEIEIGQFLGKARPFHLIIDGIDEFSQGAPQEWLPVQMGLFRYLFLKSVAREYQQKIFITISLRSYIYHAASGDVQRDRYPGSIFNLNWETSAAIRFLNARIQKVRGGNFARSHLLVGDRPFASWLGFEAVTPTNRGQDESVEKYFLRHTRLSPRSIIRAFHALVELQNNLSKENAVMSQVDFKKVVKESAHLFGDHMITTAAEEALAFTQDKIIQVDTHEKLFAAVKYTTTSFEEVFLQAIKNSIKERVDRDFLRSEIKNQLLHRFEFNHVEVAQKLAADLEGVLWRSSIVAYNSGSTDAPDWKFCWSRGQSERVDIPENVTELGFHTTMIEVCGVVCCEGGAIDG